MQSPIAENSIRPGATFPAVVNANVSTAQVFPDALQSATAALTLPVGGSGKFDGRKFRVRASGYATTAGAYTVTATLGFAAAVPATPLTLSNWTTLGASSARSVSTTSAPWWIEADLIFDQTALLVHGTFEAMVNNLFNAKAAISNALTITAAADPELFLVAALTFSTGSATNKGVLSEFIVGSV